jgi:hypothetical protein
MTVQDQAAAFAKRRQGMLEAFTMSAPEPLGITVTELKQLLKAVEPGVLMIRPRILRRVIKHHLHIPGLGLQVPHRKSFVIDRESLLKKASLSELGLTPGCELPAILTLLNEPEPEKLAGLPRGAVLVRYWRMLFHSRVHQVAEQLSRAGKLGPIEMVERIASIGREEFEEIRSVLKDEKFLLPPGDDLAVYTEFAAVYLELRFFAPALLRCYFPGIRDWQFVDRWILTDIPADSVLVATRPAGAPDPAPPAEEDHEAVDPQERPVDEPQAVDDLAARQLSAQGCRTGALANNVRSARQYARAARVAGAPRQAEMEAAAIAELGQLCRRLRAALELEEGAAARWHEALTPLLRRAVDYFWPVEARLLYDLQKICNDCEREIYALDLVEWALTLGRRPIKRRLATQHLVLQVKHLRQALGRLPASRLRDRERRELFALLSESIHKAEESLRGKLGPILHSALDEIGMKPGNLPEGVARDKLAQELLDRIEEHGYLNMGNLRDALSRNQLKLPDMQEPSKFLAGDCLLNLNRRLAVQLDGIYRPGEIYLRWLQRLSAAAFGTNTGRFLVRYLVLPFGGAFVGLEGLQHMIHAVIHLLGGEAYDRYHLATPLSVGLLGLFVLALLHVRSFRALIGKALVVAAGLLRTLFFDWPAAFLRLPLVQQILQSRPFVLLNSFLLKPLSITVALAPVFWLYDVKTRPAWISSAVIFLALSVLGNTRVGRSVEEALTDALVRTWLRFRVDLIPRLLRFTLELFRFLVEEVERCLYMVDEWLRFRSGEGRLSLAAKASLGVVWCGVTYLVRIYVNLLIEPTVNPIKHFPVVTVGAKLILPFTIPLTHVLADFFQVFGPMAAEGIALLHVVFIPGIFGFLVWELKENWKLYEANRPPNLKPVMIGHHGETLRGLLRPGFHSGTIPKLYARLRRAERRAQRSGSGAGSRGARLALRELEELVRHFVERELISLLSASKSWRQEGLACGGICFSTNRIDVELSLAQERVLSFTFSFQEQYDLLIARVACAPWLTELDKEQRTTLATALAGLFKLGSTDQVGSAPAGDTPTSVPNFRTVAIPWTQWVETWEKDQAGQGPSAFALGFSFVLPGLPE